MWWGQVEKKLIFSTMANLISLVTKTTSAFLEVNTVSIDNWAFKSYYKVTTTLLVFCSIIVTSRQFFGAPIVCDAGSVSHFFNLRHDPIKKGPTVISFARFTLLACTCFDVLWQCCQIWWFVAILASFWAGWQPKFSYGDLELLLLFVLLFMIN